MLARTIGRLEYEVVCSIPPGSRADARDRFVVVVEFLEIVVVQHLDRSDFPVDAAIRLGDGGEELGVVERVRANAIEAVLCVPIGADPAIGAIYLQERTRRAEETRPGLVLGASSEVDGPTMTTPRPGSGCRGSNPGRDLP